MTDASSTQSRSLPLLATAEQCSGSTYIVTGANTGLGFEAAKHLVKLGAAKVIMGVRNAAAGETARADIEQSTGISNVAEVWQLDLSNYDSVKAFAKKAITELDRIDALIENAAVAMAERVLAEGHILPVTVNVYSTFLLGFLLFPKMIESFRSFGTSPHLVIVASRASFDCQKEWEDIRDNPMAKLDDTEFPQLKRSVFPINRITLIQV